MRVEGGRFRRGGGVTGFGDVRFGRCRGGGGDRLFRWVHQGVGGVGGEASREYGSVPVTLVGGWGKVFG